MSLGGTRPAGQYNRLGWNIPGWYRGRIPRMPQALGGATPVGSYDTLLLQARRNTTGYYHRLFTAPRHQTRGLPPQARRIPLAGTTGEGHRPVPKARTSGELPPSEARPVGGYPHANSPAQRARGMLRSPVAALQYFCFARAGMPPGVPGRKIPRLGPDRLPGYSEQKWFSSWAPPSKPSEEPKKGQETSKRPSRSYKRLGDEIAARRPR